jgi:hypothetical protein
MQQPSDKLPLETLLQLTTTSKNFTQVIQQWRSSIPDLIPDVSGNCTISYFQSCLDNYY